MAKDRKDLHSLLKQILGSDNVYYQPPQNRQMSYPAIRYNLDDIDDELADDKTYLRKRVYRITLICALPDSEVIDALLDLPFCNYVSHYTSENLNHDVFRITW